MLAHLRRTYPAMCRHWFDDVELLDIAGGTMRLVVHEPVQLKYLQRCCTAQFTEAAQVATNRLLAVRFVSEEQAETAVQHHHARGNERSSLRASGSSAVSAASAVAAGRDSRAQASGAAANGQRAGGEKASATPGTLGRIGPRTASIPAARVVEPKRTDAGILPPDDEMLLSPDYSFDNFVPGPGNKLALAAAMAVAEKPGRAYNPFFIYGGVGLGKTHLLQAICQATMRSLPGVRIYYTSCDGFRSQFHEAVRHGAMLDFRHRFRDVDVLVVDDIHDLSQHEQTQEEFFHTFNSLYQAGKQVVLSSDAQPCEIPALEERLVSRFNCGLVARIDKPCYETRVSIVLRKAALRQVPVTPDVASYIATRIDSNIRELEGAIVKLQSLAVTYERQIDLDLAKEAIGERQPGAPSSGLTIQAILDIVTEFYDVRLTDLLSKRRHKSITRPRQTGMFLARRHTRYSLEEIGSYFGGRDHTTVMHAIRAVERRRKTDPCVEREIGMLEQRLLGQPRIVTEAVA